MPTITKHKEFEALGEQIRKKRLRLNLTQSQFAQKIGVRQQQVSEWEQGKRLRLLHVAVRLSRVLGKFR